MILDHGVRWQDLTGSSFDFLREFKRFCVECSVIIAYPFKPEGFTSTPRTVFVQKGGRGDFHFP
jgi:hypothetical protein